VNSTGVGTLGRVAQVVTLPEKMTVDSHVTILRPNKDAIDPYYFGFAVRSRERFIETLGEGSTGQTELSRHRLGEVEIRVPRLLEEQRAIAHILGSLDDKIELNRRMNQTLEAMARAIFKSWFVDFDPVRAKAECRPTGLPDDIAALFPDSFEDSELGEIPKGWEVKVLGEIATTAFGGQWGEEKPGKGLVPAICLRGCDMEDLRNEGYAPKAPVRFIKENAIEKRLTRENDLLIAASGAGPCGRPLYCSSLIEQIYNEPVIYSNFVKRFSTSAPEYAVFLDRLFHVKFIDKSIQDFITGTSVPNLDSKGLIAGFRIIVPPKQILKVFYKQNQPIFEKLYSVENVVLSNLRDTLLPKLISGELRVPDAEKFVEEAGV
jgi:type I restriction enzyme, S subunit